MAAKIHYGLTTLEQIGVGFYAPSEQHLDMGFYIWADPDGSAIISGTHGGYNVKVGPGDTLVYQDGVVWRIRAPRDAFGRWKQINRATVHHSDSNEICRRNADCDDRTVERNLFAILPDGSEHPMVPIESLPAEREVVVKYRAPLGTEAIIEYIWESTPGRAHCSVHVITLAPRPWKALNRWAEKTISIK